MIREESFGELEGQPVRAFRIDGNSGVSLLVSDYGARLVELHVPGTDGETADIVLGFDNVQDYAASAAYFGATVGRYGNRIREGRFRLAGHDYKVDCNEGPNHVHGGRNGWDTRLWSTEQVSDTSVRFETMSGDGEMGFPGACKVRSTYELDGLRLRITMEAVPDSATIINMVHHSYFNLAGHESGTVLEQLMTLASDHYVPVDDELLSTGEILRVEGTPYDFRALHPIGKHLAALPSVGAEVFEGGGGWDHNWCLRDIGDAGLRDAAEIIDPLSGRRLRLRTTEPGVQMYTAGYLNDSVVGKGGHPYCQYAGFTLETQKFPDSPRFSHFPTTRVGAGETYRQEMEFDFSPV
ncbi:MAG: aldose epimerase family protein [Actinomycetes bacterium]